MGGVFLCPTPRRRASGTRRRVDVSASSHRDRVACVNDSTAISWFHCLSARSRATRGRSRRWGRETTPHRKERKSPLRREPESSGNRARHGRRAANARTAPTALRRPRAFADQHPFVVARQSIRIIPSRSRVESTNSPPRSFESFSSPSPLDARAPSVVSFRGLSVRPVRSFRPHRRRWSSPFLVSSSPASSSSFSSSPRLGFESRARSLSRHRDFHSFVWVDEVLGFTSYDSRMYPCANNHEL